MDSPVPTPRQPAVCPSAPRKPKRREVCEQTSTQGIEDARASISTMSDGERQQVLQLIPRQSIEAIFCAYCDWLSHVSTEPFQGLTELVADLDFQLYHQACSAFPGLTWEAWAEQVHMAADNQGLRHDLARGIMLSLAGSTRRALSFD